jgi:putative transposase
VADPRVNRSGHRHRESDVWQRRYWEHAVGSDAEFEGLLDDIPYNPVRHGLTSCPHLWPDSGFGRWVRAGLYPGQWGCCRDGRAPALPASVGFGEMAGE